VNYRGFNGLQLAFLAASRKMTDPLSPIALGLGAASLTIEVFGGVKKGMVLRIISSF
jgi:hypothetical protein